MRIYKVLIENMIGKIYKIVNTIDDMVYIGSTIKKRVHDRFCAHKCEARKISRTSLLYTHMRLIGIENFSIEIIREIKVLDKGSLVRKEFREIARWPAIQLLNMNTVCGKHCDAHKEKTRAANINSLTKRGSLKIHQTTNADGKEFLYVRFVWQALSDDKKTTVQKLRSFAVNKYGLEQAMSMARALQKEIYPHIQQ